MQEEEKFILVYTEYYYLNKEIKNYIDNQLLKLNRERIGKILALYDSSIRNRTLNVNMLELQNRINELRIFNDYFPNQFYEKVKELRINQEREEFLETKKQFESILENERTAINNIKNNLSLFNKKQTFIEKQFTTLNVKLREYANKVFTKVEGYDNYIKIQEIFESKKLEFKDNLKKAQDKIDMQINSIMEATPDSNKLIPEIRESYVRIKNSFTNEYENRIKQH